MNKNIEVEGGEIAILNSHGDLAIIPKDKRNWVKQKLSEGCHSCIDSLVETLPVANQYAQDGSWFPSWMNPHNWGVTDYTDKGDFNTAYSSARKAGEKVFLYNNKRYNTDYKGTPQQQLKETGLTNKQITGNKRLKKVYKNTTPYTSFLPPLIQGLKGYAGFEDKNRDIDVENPFPIAYYLENNQKVFRDLPEEEQKRYKELSKPYFKRADDAWALYTGNSQRFKTFEISNHKPSNSKNKDDYYYSLNKSYPELLEFIEKEGINLKIGESKQVEEPTGLALRNFKIGRGQDEKGDYISYYDIWNLNPSFEFPIPEQGKPFEIYDRIYTKDYGDGKQKRMYYTDKELFDLDVNKKNFDTLALQKELVNRGYKLPKSTKEDGSLDGIWGDETKSALLQYQKAENAGLPVQSFANKVLANKEDYTANTIKQAVFAKNATKFKHELGGLTEKDYLGYKNNSPYKDNKSLVINSSDITMKDVKVPILGVSDKGDIKYMSPENNYKFKGSQVLEIPIKAQTGLKFKQKLDVTPYDIDYLKLTGNRDSKLLFEKPIITQLLEDKPVISKKSLSFNKPFELLKTPEIKGDIFNSQFKDRLNRTANFKLKDYSPEAPTDNKFKLSNEQKLILSGIGASFINNTKKQAELEKYLKNHGYTNPYKLESMYTDRRNYYNNIEPLITNRDIQNNITSSVNAAIQQGNVNNPALNNLMAKGIKLYNDSVITSRANSNKFLDDATDKLANYSSQKQIADNMLNMQRNKQKGKLISNQVTLQDKLIEDAIEQGILKPNDDKAYLEYLKKYLVLQNSESGRKALDAKANLGLKLGGYIKNK